MIAAPILADFTLENRVCEGRFRRPVFLHVSPVPEGEKGKTFKAHGLIKTDETKWNFYSPIFDVENKDEAFGTLLPLNFGDVQNFLQGDFVEIRFDVVLILVVSHEIVLD